MKYRRVISMVRLTTLKLYPKNVKTLKTILLKALKSVSGLCSDNVLSKNYPWLSALLCQLKWEQPSFLFRCLWLPKPWWLVFVSLIVVSLVYRLPTPSTFSLCAEVLINSCVDILAPRKHWVLWETELNQRANRIPCCSLSSHLWVINVHLVVFSNAWCLPYYIK